MAVPSLQFLLTKTCKNLIKNLSSSYWFSKSIPSGDYTEAIEIHYDPETVKFENLLDLFWNNHEYGLTTKIKRQYASIIFYHNDEQKKIAEGETFIETFFPKIILYAHREPHNRTESPFQRENNHWNHQSFGVLPSWRVIYLENFLNFFSYRDLYSYHQKYRLQGHKDLAKELGLNTKLLQTSFVAARLNGYLAGVGGVKQFEEEADSLGLSKKQIAYVLHYVKENEGGGLYC